jgi:uncharacterized protein YecT (DUF1311 family)
VTKLALAAAIALSAAPAAFAQSEEPRMSAQFEQCVKRAGGATFPTIECMSEEHKRWDAELNQQYRAIRARLDGARRNGFDAAQHAWLGFRDANCSFYNDPNGGTIARLNANSCMLEMTARRVIELRRIRNDVDR